MRSGVLSKTQIWRRKCCHQQSSRCFSAAVENDSLKLDLDQAFENHSIDYSSHLLSESALCTEDLFDKQQPMNQFSNLSSYSENIQSSQFTMEKKAEVFARNEANLLLPGKRMRKTVRFDFKVRVIQIPTIEVYERLGIADSIWWKESEFDEFKEEAVNELRVYMINTKTMDSKIAIHRLYINEHPESLSYFDGCNVNQNLPSTLSSPATSCDTVNSENLEFASSISAVNNSLMVECRS